MNRKGAETRMFKTLLEKIDAKLITSVGGILLAGFLSFVIYKILTNDLAHINVSIERQIGVQEKTNDVLSDLGANLSAQTEVLRIIELRTR